MTSEDILKLCADSFAAFLKKEVGLLHADVNERSMTHKLAEHLQQRFPDLDVDCEYNRLGMAIKKIHEISGDVGTPSNSDTEGTTIFPDIVVHERLEKKNNLLVIEVKKSTNKKKGDEKKLCALTREGEYHYQLGLHVVVDTKNRVISQVTCYAGGDIDASLTKLARDMS